MRSAHSPRPVDRRTTDIPDDHDAQLADAPATHLAVVPGADVVPGAPTIAARTAVRR